MEERRREAVRGEQRGGRKFGSAAAMDKSDCCNGCMKTSVGRGESVTIVKE